MNQYRMGILKVYDNLSLSLGWSGFAHEVGRIMLVNALRKSSESEAKKYLEQLYILVGDVLCTKTQLKT